MGVFTHTMADLTSPIAPARLFQAFCVDNHNFMPKAVPEFVKSVDVIEAGDSNSVGSVKQINFPAGGPYTNAKNRVDEIDASKNYVKYTTIGGDVLGETYEYQVYEAKFEPAATGGSHYTMVAHFHTKGDAVVGDQEIGFGKASIKKMFNAAEEYLNANPQLYA